MSFRVRLAVAAAVAVAVAVALAVVLAYAVVRSQLRSEVDDALSERVDQIQHVPINVEGGPGRFFLRIPGPALGGAAGYVQVVAQDGTTLRPEGAAVPLPAGSRVTSVAAGRTSAYFSDARVTGTHVRVLTAPLGQGYAVQVARPLSEVDDTLSRTRNLLIVVALAGIGIAALLGLAVARAALAPVRRLTQTTEEVTETGDLTRRIDVRGRDELNRLAASFNTMLAALEESARSQRQLVADASHELRTPLTSLRTNIEVLARDESMPAEERERLLHDVVEQLGEMSALVTELVELAREEQDAPAGEDVRLDLVAAEAVERAQRNRPGIKYELDAEPSLVHGLPGQIERAISNLLDNAGKWSREGDEVDVRVREGEVSVRDHGPGIAAEDLPRIFDNFYRAPAARGMPGSGLGLAIVRRVAESHGGTAVAEPAEGGGTVVRLSLPEQNSS
jgi:two-component system, OmpR family, sensor histidine kinase MprB